MFWSAYTDGRYGPYPWVVVAAPDDDAARVVAESVVVTWANDADPILAGYWRIVAAEWRRQGRPVMAEDQP